MPTQTWKAVERRICRMFRRERNPGSGSNGGSGSRGDCYPLPNDPLYLEIKHFAPARVPGFALWKDTKAKAEHEKKTPIVVYHVAGTSIYLAVCEASYLADLINGKG